jgi:dTDP-4-dehydrorhamnose reductase
MRILITGCKGQVGYSLKKLLENKADITTLALDRSGLDIVDEDRVKSVVTNFKPSVIINAAAYTAVDKAESERELAYAINCDGPKYLAQAAEKIGALLLHISTDYVFSGDKVGEYDENDVTGPRCIYGKSKLAGEKAIHDNCTKYIILRTAWVFGEHGNNFVKTMLRLSKTRESLAVVADQFGGPTYAGDIANAILAISKQIERDSHAYGVYHFSGFPHVSWHHFAEKIFEIALDQDVLTQPIKVNPITTLDYPTPAKRPANSRLNCDKIHNAFDIEQSDWQAALVRIQEYS